jgi:hypothetical protein
VEFGGNALLHVLANGVPLAAGWNCSYFNNTTFSGTPVLTRAETVLDVDWKAGSPDPSVERSITGAPCVAAFRTYLSERHASRIRYGHR